MVPPRKVSDGLLGRDRSEPSTKKPLRYKPQEDNGVKVDDVQDSDEDMKDSDDESEVDEGSLYSPSGTPSEIGREEINADEDFLGPPPEDCRFLVLLPRELRDKIYGYVMKLDTPISNHRTIFKCLSCPGLTDTANTSPSNSQMYEARNILRTCHQIRDEGQRVFHEVNSWGLHRARLRETLPANLFAMIDDTRRQFEMLHKNKATKNFKHTKMQICLSPLAYWDLTIPNSVELDDPVAIHLFELSQRPSVLASHKLDETAQCELLRAAFNGLVENRPYVFPNLRSITLEVSLHAKDPSPGALNDPLNRCGITFYVRIKLGHKKRTKPTYGYNAPLAPLVPGSFTSNPYPPAAHKQSLDPLPSDDLCSAPLLDPRRRMLSPLRQLLDIQSVEVERRWTVRYRQTGPESGAVTVQVQPLRQLWRFCNVTDMLESAGEGFGEFLDPALDYLKTRREDVVEIIENTSADIEHHLIT